MAINTKANKVPRPSGDLEKQLERQISFLERSCKAYDEGAFDEAIRIATTIRTLVHNTQNSHALLSQMGIQEKLSFVDTGTYRHLLDTFLSEWVKREHPGSSIATRSPSDVGLVEAGKAGEGRVGWYAPLRLLRHHPNSPLSNGTRSISTFNSWWTDPLIESSKLKSFSRSQLTLIMANQDGGAHVDPELDADYQDLCLDPLMQAEYGINSQSKSIEDDVLDIIHNVAFASIRQIAFELMATLDRYRYAQENHGIFALAQPFAAIVYPPPPHDQISLTNPIVIGKLASNL